MSVTLFDCSIANLRRVAYGRIRPLRLLLQLLAIVLSGMMIVPPVSADDAKCVDTMMKNYSRLVKSWGKDIADCLKEADTSGMPTAEACSISDPKGRIAKAAQKLIDEAVGGAKDKCGGVTPAFGYTDATTNVDAAEESMLYLAHQLFGDPLDVKNAAGDPELTTCRKILWKSSAKMASAMLKEWQGCVKDAIAAGATTNDELQQACFLGPGPLDTKGKIASLDAKMRAKLVKANCTNGMMLSAQTGARPTAVEYAVMLSLIIVVLLVALTALGGVQKGTLGNGNPTLADQWDDGAVNNSHLIGVKSDLYIGNFFTNDRLCKNDGTGAFMCGPVTEPPHNTTGVALGDFNFDNKMDVFVSSGGANNRRCINVSPATDYSCGSYPAAANNHNGIAVGTIDSGATVDAIITSTSGTFKCMNGGACVPLGYGTPETMPSRGVAIGDMNGDGTLDVVMAIDGGPNRVCYYLPVTPPPAVSYDFVCGNVSGDSAQAHQVALADFNGDKRLDAVFSYTLSTNRVCLNNGMSGFTCSDVSADATYTNGVAVGDLDGDKDVDIIFSVGDILGSPNRQCTNNGSGVFTCKDLSTDIGYFWAVSIGDLDGDGDRDAAFGQTGGTTMRCFNSSGNFTCSPVDGVMETIGDVALGIGPPAPIPTHTPTATITMTPTDTPIIIP